MKERLSRLIEVKSVVTLTLTVAMIGVLFANRPVPSEGLALFSASYGAIITYFFTRKEGQ